MQIQQSTVRQFGLLHDIIDREFVTSAKKIREFLRIFRNWKNS